MATQRRTGRRPGASGTREEILRAARVEFARKGFTGATMRSIADAAGVNVALPAHYFGGKDGLLVATLELPAEVREQLALALRGDPVDALHLTRTYLGLWEDSTTRDQLVALVRSGLGGGEAMERLRDQLSEALVASADGAREQDGRVALALSHLLGTAIMRHVARLAPVSDMSFDDLVARVAPAIVVSLSSRESSS